MVENMSLFNSCDKTGCSGFSDIGEQHFRVRRRALTGPKQAIRVVVMGSPEVGKTSLINQYMRQKFKEDYLSAVSNMHNVPDDRIVLEIFDTEGCLNTNLRNIAIRTAHAFVLVYAVDNEGSFDNMVKLRNEILRTKGSDIPMVVVGNKVDIKERVVHPVMADCVVTIDWECDHFEVSATEDLDMKGIFNKLLSHPRLGLQLMAVANSPPRPRTNSLPKNTLLSVKKEGRYSQSKIRSPWTDFKRIFNF